MGATMIDDIELAGVAHIRHEAAPDFTAQRIAGLEGTLYQRIGRRSHRVLLSGSFLPAKAQDDLKTLQEKAQAGEEVTFAADIVTALSIEKMVISSLVAEQEAGRGGQFRYAIALDESPPLPPPAEVSAFGGLDSFGLGDLGFEPGALGEVLSDIADQASAITGAVDAALDAVDQLSALADLGNLASIGNPLRPLIDAVEQLGDIGGSVGTVLGGLSDLIGGQR